MVGLDDPRKFLNECTRSFAVWKYVRIDSIEPFGQTICGKHGYHQETKDR